VSKEPNYALLTSSATLKLEHRVIEITSRWEGITFQFREAFIIGLPFIRGTQETNLTGLIDYQEVFERVALLLAAVEFLLVLGIGGAMDWSLSTIMPKRGGSGATFVRCAASSSVKSPAVRAGRSSWCAKA
jgi:hypothetical protein